MVVHRTKKTMATKVPLRKAQTPSYAVSLSVVPSQSPVVVRRAIETRTDIDQVFLLKYECLTCFLLNWYSFDEMLLNWYDNGLSWASLSVKVYNDLILWFLYIHFLETVLRLRTFVKNKKTEKNEHFFI